MGFARSNLTVEAIRSACLPYMKVTALKMHCLTEPSFPITVIDSSVNNILKQQIKCSTSFSRSCVCVLSCAGCR